ncbi:hypothetical protein SDC9_128642 [bioreactor metagenome]|uniref:Uncharacterized protein n=1 Tax=bioreactor metagenome TaxID=1076179 RepID=A0A645CXM6_9ZZZZ
MQPFFERADGDRRMVVVRHRNDDRVDRAGLEQLFGRIEDLAIRRGEFRFLVRPLFVAVADRGEFRLRNVLHAGDMRRAHIADADDADPDLVHGVKASGL